MNPQVSHHCLLQGSVVHNQSCRGGYTRSYGPGVRDKVEVIELVGVQLLTGVWRHQKPIKYILGEQD